MVAPHCIITGCVPPVPLILLVLLFIPQQIHYPNGNVIIIINPIIIVIGPLFRRIPFVIIIVL